MKKYNTNDKLTFNQFIDFCKENTELHHNIHPTLIKLFIYVAYCNMTNNGYWRSSNNYTLSFQYKDIEEILLSIYSLFNLTKRTTINSKHQNLINDVDSFFYVFFKNKHSILANRKNMFVELSLKNIPLYKDFANIKSRIFYVYNEEPLFKYSYFYDKNEKLISVKEPVFNQKGEKETYLLKTEKFYDYNKKTGKIYKTNEELNKEIGFYFNKNDFNHEFSNIKDKEKKSIYMIFVKIVNFICNSKYIADKWINLKLPSQVIKFLFENKYPDSYQVRKKPQKWLKWRETPQKELRQISNIKDYYEDFYILDTGFLYTLISELDFETRCYEYDIEFISDEIFEQNNPDYAVSRKTLEKLCKLSDRHELEKLPIKKLNRQTRKANLAKLSYDDERVVSRVGTKSWKHCSKKRKQYM